MIILFYLAVICHLLLFLLALLSFPMCYYHHSYSKINVLTFQLEQKIPVLPCQGLQAMTRQRSNPCRLRTPLRTSWDLPGICQWLEQGKHVIQELETCDHFLLDTPKTMFFFSEKYYPLWSIGHLNNLNKWSFGSAVTCKCDANLLWLFSNDVFFKSEFLRNLVERAAFWSFGHLDPFSAQSTRPESCCKNWNNTPTASRRKRRREEVFRSVVAWSKKYPRNP